MSHCVPRVRPLMSAFAALGVALLAPLAGAASAEDVPAMRVIVLANRDEPESLELARHYAGRRGIPEGNIVALPMARRETVDWHEFVAQVFDPLQAWLVENGWIDAISMEVRDPVGRRKLAVAGHRIAFLVVCRGVPLKIRETADVRPDSSRRAPDRLRTHRAAVDSELALLGRAGPPLDGFVPNPLFARDSPTAAEQAKVIRVSRLDGPSLAAARQLVDGAMAAERHGLIGRAYVDLGGPHPLGDRWLEAVAKQIDQLGFDVAVQRERSTMGSTDRADAAALYFGWYDENVSGPFALPGYRFAPGAIALHIHSFSSSTLGRENGGGWCGPLVAKGVAATFGNVYEPYLEYTHQPHLVMRALARGASLGEAAAYAMPVLSWQTVTIGDPLYRPFPIPGREQAEHWRGLPPALAPHAVLRRVRQLERAGRDLDAIALLREAGGELRSVELAMERIRRRRVGEDRRAAADLAQLIRRAGSVSPDQWALWAEAARLLERAGEPALARQGWNALLAQALPEAVRAEWEREARAGDQPGSAPFEQGAEVFSAAP